MRILTFTLMLIGALTSLQTPTQADTITYQSQLLDANGDFAWDGEVLANPLIGFYPIGGGANETDTAAKSNWSIIEKKDFRLALRFSGMPYGNALPSTNDGTYYSTTGEYLSGSGLSTWRVDVHWETKNGLKLNDFTSSELKTNFGTSSNLKTALNGNAYLRQFSFNGAAGTNSTVDIDAETVYSIGFFVELDGQSWEHGARLVVSDDEQEPPGTDPVPEPGSIVLLGVAGVATLYWRRRKKHT